MNTPPPSTVSIASTDSEPSLNPLGLMSLRQLKIYKRYLEHLRAIVRRLEPFRDNLWWQMETYELNGKWLEVHQEIAAREDRAATGSEQFHDPPSPSPMTSDVFPIYNSSEGNWSEESPASNIGR